MSLANSSTLLTGVTKSRVTVKFLTVIYWPVLELLIFSEIHHKMIDIQSKKFAEITYFLSIKTFSNEIDKVDSYFLA